MYLHSELSTRHFIHLIALDGFQLFRIKSSQNAKIIVFTFHNNYCYIINTLLVLQRLKWRINYWVNGAVIWYNS